MSLLSLCLAVWGSSPFPAKHLCHLRRVCAFSESSQALKSTWHAMKACLCTPPYSGYKCFGFVLRSSPPMVSVTSTNVCKPNIHGFKPTISRKFGTVPNMIAVGREQRKRWVSSLGGRSVPFLTHLEKHRYVYFIALHQRSDCPTQLLVPSETSGWPNPQPTSSPWCHRARPWHAVLPSTPSYPFCFPPLSYPSLAFPL